MYWAAVSVAAASEIAEIGGYVAVTFLAYLCPCHEGGCGVKDEDKG